MINEYPQVSYPKEENLILPYIVAFLAEQQDKLLLWPDQIDDHSKFIQQLGRNVLTNESVFPFARGFEYKKNYLNIYITFPTTSKEPGSGRLGLRLTLGALIHKRVFKRFIPCRYFIDFYLARFNRIFHLDLNAGGATEFTDQLQNKNNYSDLSNKISELLSDLLSCLFLIRKNEPSSVLNKILILFSKKEKTFRFPKFILCMKDENYIKYLLTFFTALDRYIQTQKTLRKVNFFALNDKDDKSLVIIPCLPDDQELIKAFAKSNLLAYVDSHSKCINLSKT